MAKYYEVPAENIFVGNGSDETIDLLLRGWCEPGRDKALTFSPTFGMYKVSAAINGVQLTEVPLDKEYQPERGSYENLLSDPALKIIFLCSPNNPTGNLIHRNAIKQILEHFAGPVVVDEAYIEFADAPSITAWCHQYPRLVVLRTLSKAWGLAGARVGAAIAHPKVIQVLQRIKPPYNLSTLAQKAAVEALLRPELMARDVRLLLKARKVLENALADSPYFTKVYHSDANFVLATTPYAAELYRYLGSADFSKSYTI
jgi:histidinol-phosphate aminotransferase